MVFGCDEYGRYVEVGDERFAIESFPYWKWHPIYLMFHVRKRFEIIVWHLSRLTGLGWTQSERKT